LPPPSVHLLREVGVVNALASILTMWFLFAVLAPKTFGWVVGELFFKWKIGWDEARAALAKGDE